MENTARTHSASTTTLTRAPVSTIPLSANVDRMVETIEVRKSPITPPTPLPDWLTAYTPAEQQAMENGTLVKHPRTKAHLELEELTFDLFFERFLDDMVEGHKPQEIIRGDPRNIPMGRFMRWILKNPGRKERYEEAQTILTELLVLENDDIAEGLTSMEDIERSKLRIKNNEFKIKTWNKPKYGDTKQVDINMNTVIDIRALIEKRDQQLATLEGEYTLMDNT